MIVKCSHCKEMFDEIAFDEHQCDIPLNGVKKIEVVYFHDGSYRNKKLLTALGIDGILYSFEVVSRKAIQMLYPSTVNMEKKSHAKLPEPAYLLHVVKTIIVFLKVFRQL